MQSRSKIYSDYSVHATFSDVVNTTKIGSTTTQLRKKTHRLCRRSPRPDSVNSRLGWYVF